MFRKMFLSPFFAPIFFGVLWGALLLVVLVFFNEQKFELTTDGQLIDILTYTGYGLMLFVMLCLVKDFKDKMLLWSISVMLGVAALLREAGIQHHLSSTDSTPFKSRFFLNPNNPLSEKIIFGAVLIMIFGALLYLAIKYTKHLVTSFFKLDTITWSIATFCGVLVFAKFADRFPSHWRHLNNLDKLPRDFIDIWSLLEESSELFLPYLVIIILLQHHLCLKKRLFIN
ncbi:MAG: hypothetical protein J6X42_06165 [Alphaproteobacteria bacterium]|nr:hypothetical protein [Alphaproteobacteria bacterium]